MNLRCFTSVVRPGGRWFLPFLLLALVLVPFSGVTQPLATWINSGPITTPPQIDATNVVNSGTMNFYTSRPFTTSDTLNFTNSGTMIESAGWIFDCEPSSGGQSFSAANFDNQYGFIEGLFSSKLWVSATNIINDNGVLEVDANGWLKLVGTNVSLSRSGVEVAAIVPIGSSNGTTNFYSDFGITDNYWAQTNMTFDSSALWDGSTASTPSYAVAALGLLSGRRQFFLDGPLTSSYCYTNLMYTNGYPPAPTNIIKQAVFVGLGAGNMKVQISYIPSSIPTNLFKTVAVHLSVNGGLSNAVTGLPETYTDLYFYDTLAAETNRGILQNIATLDTYRPANYILSRLSQGAGFTTTTVPNSAFFYDSTFSNSIVSGDYAAYSAGVTNIVSTPPSVLGVSITNFPGRVQIYADSLDMTLARVRGEGEIVIQTRDLLSSSNAIVDCENLSFNLGKINETNGPLNVMNLAKSSVARLKGKPVAWSALWTNSLIMIIPPDPGNTNGLLTNIVNLGFHTLMLDASAFLTQVVPVNVFDLVTHSTNVVVSDTMNLVQSFYTDGRSFTLNGGITFSSFSYGSGIAVALNNWVYTNAPCLLYFTNNGTLTVPGEAHFGDDRANPPCPYSTFINPGIIRAGSLALNSAYFENSGAIFVTPGPLTMQGVSGKLVNGQSSSVGDADFVCGTLKFSSHTLNSGKGVNFTVTNALFDAGAVTGFGSTLTMSNGFNLWVKPPTGDLLGTTFQSRAPNYVKVNHYWAGDDRGPIAAGYTNNVAIGKLVLGPVGGSGSPQLYFEGTNSSAHNGLYVDLLDLSNISSTSNLLFARFGIDPSLVIYYAAAKIGFTPPNNSGGTNQETEEYLDGQFGGHLRWVSGFAGPNSSTSVVVNGVTVQVNKALRFSKIIDSNGDGIPNFYDSDPFSLKLAASVLPVNPPPSTALALSWSAAPDTIYQVLFSTNLSLNSWQPLLNYTNNTATNQAVTVWDANAPAAGGPCRFYRVSYIP